MYIPIGCKFVNICNRRATPLVDFYSSLRYFEIISHLCAQAIYSKRRNEELLDCLEVQFTCSSPYHKQAWDRTFQGCNCIANEHPIFARNILIVNQKPMALWKNYLTQKKNLSVCFVGEKQAYLRVKHTNSSKFSAPYCKGFMQGCKNP